MITRYKINKNSEAWRTAAKIFEKHIEDLSPAVQQELNEIIKWDLPVAVREDKETIELVQKLRTELKTLGYKIQVLKAQRG